MNLPHFLVTTASIASGGVIIAALLVVGTLINDINSFYNDALHDMAEFKVILLQIRPKNKETLGIL